MNQLTGKPSGNGFNLILRGFFIWSGVMFENKQKFVKFIENGFTEDETNLILYFVRNEPFENIIPNPIEFFKKYISVLKDIMWEKGEKQLKMRDKLKEIEQSRIGKIEVIDWEYLSLEGKFDTLKRDLWITNERIKLLDKVVSKLEKREKRKNLLNRFFKDDKEINIKLLELKREVAEDIPKIIKDKNQIENFNEIISKCFNEYNRRGKLGSRELKIIIESVYKKRQDKDLEIKMYQEKTYKILEKTKLKEYFKIKFKLSTLMRK